MTAPQLAAYTFLPWVQRGVGRIAKELGISRKTVESHCGNIKLKLGCSDAKALKHSARQFLGSQN